MIETTNLKADFWYFSKMSAFLKFNNLFTFFCLFFSFSVIILALEKVRCIMTKKKGL